MVRVTVGNNMNRKNIIVENDATIRQVLEENGIDYATTGMNLDGVSLRPGDFDKTFDELGVGDHCYLLSVTKTDNA